MKMEFYLNPTKRWTNTEERRRKKVTGTDNLVCITMAIKILFIVLRYWWSIHHVKCALHCISFFFFSFSITMATGYWFCFLWNYYSNAHSWIPVGLQFCIVLLMYTACAGNKKNALDDDGASSSSSGWKLDFYFGNCFKVL